ncbi:MAG: hypothetical protein PHG97_06425 [Candidatus Margulisbacteria bacterium]|nr:hypothetical protein [Candidatus Margulisiibacteriota bacterium]
MAIENRIRNFIGGLQGHILVCHHLTYALSSFVRGRVTVPTLEESTVFGQELEAVCRYLHPCKIREQIPTNLYDVFAFLKNNGEIGHSTIVIDHEASKPDKVVDINVLSGEILFTPVQKLAEFWGNFGPAFLIPANIVGYLIENVEHDVGLEPDQCNLRVSLGRKGRR